MAAELSNAVAAALDLPNLCRAVAEFSPMPMVGVEGVTHIVRYVNPAFCLLIGKPKEELIGDPFCNIAPAGEECLSLLSRVYRTGLAEIHTGQDNNGSVPLYWSYAMWPVLATDRSSLGIMIQVTESNSSHQGAVAMNQALLLSSVRQHELADAADILNTQLQAEISVRKRAQEALIASEKLTSAGRMAATTAHEINNPLAAVTNLLFLTKNTDGLPAPARQYLEIADGELKRIAHITRQTLGFYRESAAPSTFYVASLLDSVIDLLQAKVKSKGATVERQCDARLQITAVSGELRQVFSNLLLNSLDALGEGGKITMRASVSAGSSNGERRVRITVADNGQGIGVAARSQIFEPFFTTKGSIGNGLGLWVSKQLIEKHGGSIRLHSRTSGPQRGTTFSAVLPTAVA